MPAIHAAQSGKRKKRRDRRNGTSGLKRALSSEAGAFEKPLIVYFLANASMLPTKALLSWLTLSLAVLTARAVRAGRFEMAEVKDLKESACEQEVDCSRRKPGPSWVRFGKRTFHGDYGYHDVPYYVTNIPYAQCFWYFFYFPQDDRIVAPLRVKGAINYNGEKEDLCVIRLAEDDLPDCCKAPKGSNVWKYSEELVDEACKKKLCRLAKSGEWKAKGWFNQGKKSPWHATEPEQGSYGYVQAFHDTCTWKGPKGLGDLLSNFKDLSDHYGLITPAETFNKTACGCQTPDDCS